MFVLFQVLALGLIEFGRRRGEKVSGVLFIYWCLHVICSNVCVVSAACSGVDRVWQKERREGVWSAVHLLVSPRHMFHCHPAFKGQQGSC